MKIHALHFIFDQFLKMVYCVKKWNFTGPISQTVSYGQPGDKYPHFDQKMTLNIGIFQITPVFGPFDYCFVINNEEIPACVVLNVYLRVFQVALSKVHPNKAIIWIIPYLGPFLVKMWVFNPPGCRYIYRLRPTVLQFILMNCHHVLS
jgi:hypothetical protein